MYSNIRVSFRETVPLSSMHIYIPVRYSTTGRHESAESVDRSLELGFTTSKVLVFLEIEMDGFLGVDTNTSRLESSGGFLGSEIATSEL